MTPRVVRRVARGVGLLRSYASLRVRAGFDPSWYSVLRGSELSRSAATWDYLTAGRALGRSPHALFDPDYYVARGGAHRILLEGFAGYVGSKARQQLPTHPLFDLAGYLAQAPDALGFAGGPIEHYRRVGVAGLLRPNSWYDPRAASHSMLELLREHARAWSSRQRYARGARRTPHLDTRAARRFVESYADVTPSAGSAEVTASVVIPVWNRAAQVVAAIDSVRAQTLQDWELLVVDDGSTDDLAAVVRRYSDDERIRFLRRPHEGVGAARNAGLAMARGRYVAWLDSDDTWTAEHLRVTIAFMQREGHRAGYDVLELRQVGRPPGFRTLDGGRDYLVNGSHIGQTVLVHERSLVDEIGGYDEQLPRTVDFDFILRMSAVTDFGFAPFVGCIVNHDPADTSRITTSHPAAWINVVLNRHTLDWAAAAAAARDPGGSTVVMVATADVDRTTEAVARLVETTDGLSVRIVVVDNGLALGPSQVVASLGWRHPRVDVVAAPSDRGWALAYNVGIVAVATEVVVLVEPDADPQEGWLPPLLAALEAGEVIGAGSAAPDGPEGARWVAGAFRTVDLIAVQGLDPLGDPATALADLATRLAHLRSGGFEIVESSVVRTRAGARP